MKRKALILAAVAVATIAVVVAGIVTLTREEATTDVGGMELTEGEVTDMVRDSMGAAELDDVSLATPEDRIERLPSTTSGGVMEFDLEAKPLRWEYRDGQTIGAWGFEGQVPGPEMRVPEGARVRVNFTNNLPEPTTVHWHGMDVPFRADGVPGLTQKAIEPGDSYTYEFTAIPAGTHFYHTHGSGRRDEARQLDMGLSGAFIVEPKVEAKADIEQTLVLDEWNVADGGLNAAMMSGAGHGAHNAGYNLYTINGRAAPDAPMIEIEKGQTVRLRMINAGTSATHPMHLHGHNVSVVAIDGNPVPAAAVQKRNTVVLAPGETYDVTFLANNPGVWMLHCHELHHADGGMMTAVQYQGYEPIGAEESGESAH